MFTKENIFNLTNDQKITKQHEIFTCLSNINMAIDA